ncbi:ATP-binding protein [Corallococcus exercitus]|uniref:sensor histidine kinase n=1 Tax=Corallococcus exercitus TaxID=2316736 RepID=UPI0035D4CDBF
MQTPDARQQELWRRAGRLSSALAGLTLMLGAGVLLGWAVGSLTLTRLVPGLPQMVPLTAGGLMLTACAELALGGRTAASRRLGGVLALGGVLLSVLMLSRYFGEPSRWGAPLEELGGRTSPQSASMLLMLGLALALRDAEGRWARWLFQALALGTLFLSFSVLVAYSFQEPRFYWFAGRGIGIALHTDVALLLLSLGALLLRPERGAVGAFLHAGAGGIMARRLLPALLVPVVGGVVAHQTLRHTRMDPRMVWSLLEVAQAAVLTWVVWRAATRLNALHAEQLRAEERTREDARAQRRLAEENARLYAEAGEAARAREDVLAVVSHDLKNPLSTVRLGTGVLARRLDALPEGAALQRQVAAIDRAAAHMQDLITRLLDAARLDAGQPLVMDRHPEPVEPLTVDALSLVEPQAQGKGVQLRHQLVPGLSASCDRPRILQVLANLLGNAVKFTPPGGTVTVTATPDAGAVRVSVRDTGPGIPKAHQARLFQRHWQARDTAHQGSGLGLYIACGIITAHGGRLWVDSDEGAGTTFTFTLPASPPAHPRLDTMEDEV